MPRSRFCLGGLMIGTGAAITGLGAVLALTADGSDSGSLAAVSSASLSVAPAGPPATLGIAGSTPVPTSIALTTTTSTTTTSTTTTSTTTTSTTTTSTTTTSTTTTSTMPAPTADAAVAAFFPALSIAIQQRDISFLTAHLHPFVLDRYDQASCADYLAGLDAPNYRIEVLSIGAVGPWGWQTDGITRAVADSTTVATRAAADGTTFTEGESHVQIDPAGLVRWFTDCGSPKVGAL